MRGTPSHDIAAQIALFVLQTGLSPDADGTLFNWLQSYIVKNFKHRGVERHDLSAGIVTHLLKYKWWMEDARAWRKYIAATRDGLRRSSAEHSRRPSRDRPVNAAYDGTGAVYSVDEAAHILRRSRSTIYRMLEDRRLDHTIDKNERMVISRSVIDHLKTMPTRKLVIAAVKRARGCSDAAARKYVYRQGLKQQSLA
jgi:excisionase family DNA binding protein